MQSNLERAIQFTEENKGNFDSRYRLNFHLMPPLGWVNDPNGLIYYKGEYHAFYQHHPYDKDWGPMHWGHAKSKDMVHWEHLPIALAPGDECDKGGCYSGSAIDNNGELTLVYTGHLFDDPTNRDPFSPDFHQNQNIATSTDGINFTKLRSNPVIAAPPSDNTQNFRDPKVWEKEGMFYMVVGSTAKEGELGRTLIYRSNDLKQWDYIGVLATSKGELGSMWECPDFFELDGFAVQLFSPVGMTAQGDKYKNVFQTGAIIGQYDYEKNDFQHGEFEELDRGHDFYAIQTFEAADGRRIGISWMNMWQTPMPEKDDNWAGAFTVPRELRVVDNRVRMTPVRELESLRHKEIVNKIFEVNNVQKVIDLTENSAEFLIDAKLNDSKVFGFKLSDDSGEVCEFKYDRTIGKLSFTRQGEDGERACSIEDISEINLQIFVDKSSVEIFVNKGLETFTSRIYPTSACEFSLLSDNSLNATVIGYQLSKVMDK